MGHGGGIDYAGETRAAAHELSGADDDYDELIALVGDARCVLLGEATHGSHEFYRERARITSLLIAEGGFDAVAVEADWPDAYRVNRYVRGLSQDAGAQEALLGFKRFPTWMWRNREVVDFVAWLRSYNDASPHQAGFYGLDLYSLSASIEAVLGYLWTVDGEAHRRARERYSCFAGLSDGQEYAYSAGFGGGPSCEEAATAQLAELAEMAEGRSQDDEYFAALQNARLVQDAERYYRAMSRHEVSSWNLRDQHMAATLAALDDHLSTRKGAPARLVVWEHNSHVGDARATQMGWQGELNVGQLARERYGDAARLVGFTTYTGTVTAASAWDEPAENKQVRPALPESYEAFFHAVGPERFWLPLEAGRVPPLMLERAIGVLYRPESERQSHYFRADLSGQFDVVIHLDSTRAVEPLERGELWHPGEEVPETYPSAL